MFVHLEGDLKNPVVIHSIEALATELGEVAGVHDTMHVGVLLARTYEGMVGRSGLPTSSAQASTLFGLLTGAPMISQLVSSEQNQALLQVRLKPLSLDETEAVLQDIRDLVAGYQDFGKLSLENRRERWATALLGPSSGARFERFGSMKAALKPPRTEVLAAEISKRIAGGDWLVDVGALLELRPDDVAESWQQAGETPEDWVNWLQAKGVAVEPGPMSEDAWFTLGDIAASVEESLRREALIDQALTLEEFKGTRASLQRLWDVFESQEALAGESPMTWRVNGLPVMYEGLSESIEENQARSTAAAFVAVLVLLLVVIRKLSTVFWIALPITFALICIYGGMGLLGIHLDIGTSMLASLALGVGVDYAVHAFMGEGGLSRGSAAAIVTNALVVAAGFSVLTLASSPPIQVMGALTAIAMVLAALTTLVVYTLSGRSSWLTEGKD